jgi:D-glycerate 3-kinase
MKKELDEDSMLNMTKIDLSHFLNKHLLPETYTHTVESWVLPLAEKLANQKKQSSKPIVVGINGAQGSGKTTLTDLLVYLFDQYHQLHAVALSIDDFYLKRQQRIELAKTVHPLLKTRGVPGTHDIKLAQQVVQALTRGAVTNIPRFNKATDDRHTIENWDAETQHVDVIIIEGWCLGVGPQSEKALTEPCNQLEREEDTTAVWRNFINTKLKNEYAEFFSMIDIWIMLKAPSFDSVFKWRCEQEYKLRQEQGDRNQIMDAAGIERFIKHFQRITEHALTTLPQKVDYLFELDDCREISNCIIKERKHD